MIVVDTNIIASLYLENPHRKEIETLFARDPYWFAPRLWHSELSNVLSLYSRQGIITLDDALKIMDASEEIIEKIDFESSSAKILSLAHHSGCSVYDCEFVTLASDLGVVLITFDRKLLTSFPNIAFTPAAFLTV